MTKEQKLERKLRKFMSGTVMYTNNGFATTALKFYANEKYIKSFKRYILKLFS